MEVIQIYDTINKKNLTVKVAPQIAKKCKSDPAYTQALFSQIRNKNFGTNSTIKITPVTDKVKSIENNTNTEDWSRNEIIQLINVFQSCKSNSDSPTSKTKLWSEISLKLNKKGITKSSEQCKQKWIKLLQAYYQSTNSQDQNSFEYTQEIADALYVRPKGNGKEVLHEDINEDNHGQNVRYKENWTKYDTIKFLKAYQRCKKGRPELNSGTQLWQRISDALAREGVYKSKQKLAMKWKNLYRTYRSYNSSIKQSPKRFQFFHEINCVLNGLEFPDPDPNDKTEPTEPIHSSYVVWNKEETLQLIQLYKKHQRLFKTANSKKAWEAIAEDMLAAGYRKDIEKCRNKWKSLARSYKRNNHKNGSRFDFYNEMRSIMKSKENGNFSDYGESQELTDDDSSEDYDNEDMESEEAEVMNSDGDESYEEILINDGDNAHFWPQEEIATLIDTYEILKRKFKDDEIWEGIAQLMKLKNFTRSPTECKDLWNTLFNQYTKARDAGSGSNCPFFEEMHNACKQEEENQSHDHNTTVQPKKEIKDSIDNDTNSVEDVKMINLSEAPNNSDDTNIHYNSCQLRHSCKCSEQREEGKERRHKERMEMIKRKLDIEERKLKAFELYVNHVVTRDLTSDDEDL